MSACGGPAPDSGQLTLVIQGPNGSNPLADPNAASVYLEIDDASSAVLLSGTFDIGAPMELDHVPYGPARTFKVETREASGGTLLAGQTAPLDVVKGEHLVVTVVLQ